jgi:hypothetical protein
MLVEQHALSALLQQQQLEQPGVPLEERGLAGCQVQIPHAEDLEAGRPGLHRPHASVLPLAPASTTLGRAA